MLYAHALREVFPEHVPYVLLVYAHCYWVWRSEHPHRWKFCVHTHYVGFWGCQHACMHMLYLEVLACLLMGVCTCPLCLFLQSVGVLSRTLFHMWCKLYFPMFLLSLGLLPLMSMDSLIDLAKPCSSLPIMLKLSGLVLWPAMFQWSKIGEGSLRCSLYLSTKVLEVSPIYSSLHTVIQLFAIIKRGFQNQCIL